MTKIDKEWDEEKVSEQVNQAIGMFDDGELFIEKTLSENFLFDDNKIKNASFDEDKGFGLRVVKDDSVGFAHSSELTDKSISRAIQAVKSVESGKTFNFCKFTLNSYN